MLSLIVVIRTQRMKSAALLFTSLSGRGQHRAANDGRVSSNFGFLLALKPINESVSLLTAARKWVNPFSQALCHNSK